MAGLVREHSTWKLRSRSLHLGERTRVMGIVNVTPDSFSDGGSHNTIERAVAHAHALLDDGADILDIGGESTRPGSPANTAQAISEKEEQGRVLPVIDALRQSRPHAILSVDTYRASTAELALKHGAEIVNDVSGGLWDGRMAHVCAAHGCGVVAMHTRGLPSEWAALPPLQPAQVLPTILHALHTSATRLLEAGCIRDTIVLDPGFGFGKRGDENWVLLREFAQLQELGFPLLAGLSRKGFLRSLAATPELAAAMTTDDLDTITANACATAAQAGAHIVRVHNVRATVRALAEAVPQQGL